MVQVCERVGGRLGNSNIGLKLLGFKFCNCSLGTSWRIFRLKGFCKDILGRVDEAQGG